MKNYAEAYQPDDSNKWRVRPITAGFLGPFDKGEAVMIAAALNDAYKAGRAALQSELRNLLGATAEQSND